MEGRTNIYILELQGGRYYVGKTTRWEKRWQKHCNGTATEWTRIYPPVQRVAYYENVSHFDEDKYVKEYMARYGIDNVRGGTYAHPILTEDEHKAIQNEINGALDACFRCGSTTHFIRNCPVKAGCDSDYEDESDSEEEGYCCDICEEAFEDYHDAVECQKRCARQQSQKERKGCARCGRKGHASYNCFAEMHVQGYVIDSDSD